MADSELKPIAYNIQGAARATGLDATDLLIHARNGELPVHTASDGRLIVEHDALVAFVQSLPAVVIA